VAILRVGSTIPSHLTPGTSLFTKQNTRLGEMVGNLEIPNPTPATWPRPARRSASGTIGTAATRLDKGDRKMATYHIDSEKLEAVANAYAEFEPNASTPDIEAYICADWNEGQEHQDWIQRSRTGSPPEYSRTTNQPSSPNSPLLWGCIRCPGG